MGNRKKPTAAFIGVVMFGFVLYFIMTMVQPKLKTIIFDYNTWDKEMIINPIYRILWMIGDATEPHFHKTILGGIGVLLGSIIAYILDKKQSKYRGIPISYGNGSIWPWIFSAAFLSLGITTILFGGIRIDGDAWAATFIPYVSVASAVILIYGPNMKSLLTGAILGALFTTPVTMFLRYVVGNELGMPGVIASVSGMWIGGIFTFEVCKAVPWMKLQPNTNISPVSLNGEISVSEYKKIYPNKFFIRRMIADYSEPMFVGNEIAGGCLLVGSMLTWVLSPFQPYYGTGLFPACILSQIITGSVAMYVYWDGWIDGDFFPTFVPVVSVAPAMVLLFGGSIPIIIISAVLGALTCPAIANMVNEKIPSHWHPMVGFTFSMALCSFGVTVLLKYLIIAFPFLK